MAEEVSNFESALKAFDKLSREAWTNVTFRGHADASWGVEPSLFRQKPNVAEFESEMIRELISLFPQDFLTDHSMFDRLVRMQHYGLPTRLLDVTRNPLVALFFAVWEEKYDDSDGAVLAFVASDDRCKFYDSDVVSCMANLANLKQDERDTLETTTASTIADLRELQPTGRLIQFIKAEKPYFESRIKKVDLFRPVVVTAKRANQRMSAQSGSFILYGLDAGKSPSYKKSIRTEKVVILKRAKAEIRRRLGSLGIEASTLFPEIDKATGRILEIYKSKVIPF
ncbi:MAG: FRG domain-containing protein [Sphingomonadaceae bacterium]|nr:FRG domain-containing protein [Sphingomonadaceae bacterium]MCP5390284.1 FRG domain-containing protein [Sphingomonadaceae bacterium]MCP5392384.1 FRG domain-containing protein [Sphingomonadaceae bacterium]